MDPDVISETLEALSTPAAARATGKRIHTLRGIRGTPHGEIAQVAGSSWEEDPAVLSDDRDALSELFGAAFEDGLVAIGLLAAATLDDPEEGLDLALEWAERIDDVETADALGWLVVGPAALAAGRPLPEVVRPLLGHRRPEVRRIALAAAMAATPTPVTGPAAAPLRARLDTPQVRFVDTLQVGPLTEILAASLRDEAPSVRKAARRLLRTWAKLDRDAAREWIDAVPGGVHRMLREVVSPNAKKKPRRRR